MRYGRTTSASTRTHEAAGLPEVIATAVDASRWELVLLAGVVGVAAGTVALLYPDPTGFVVTACVGAYLLALVIARLPSASALTNFQAGERIRRTLLGVLVLAAVVVFIDAELAAGIVIVAGFMEYLLLSTAAGIAIAGRFRGVGTLLVGEALVGAVIAVAVVLWAKVDIDAVATVVGVYLVLRGALDLVLAIAFRELRAA